MRHSGICPGCGHSDLSVDTIDHVLTVQCVHEHCTNRLQVEVEGALRILQPASLTVGYEPAVTVTLWGASNADGSVCLERALSGQAFHNPRIQPGELARAFLVLSIHRMLDQLDQPDAVQRIVGES